MRIPTVEPVPEIDVATGFPEARRDLSSFLRRSNGPCRSARSAALKDEALRSRGTFALLPEEVELLLAVRGVDVEFHPIGRDDVEFLPSPRDVGPGGDTEIVGDVPNRVVKSSAMFSPDRSI